MNSDDILTDDRFDFGNDDELDAMLRAWLFTTAGERIVAGPQLRGTMRTPAQRGRRAMRC